MNRHQAKLFNPKNHYKADTAMRQHWALCALAFGVLVIRLIAG